MWKIFYKLLIQLKLVGNKEIIDSTYCVSVFPESKVDNVTKVPSYLLNFITTSLSSDIPSQVLTWVFIETKLESCCNSMGSGGDSDTSSELISENKAKLSLKLRFLVKILIYDKYINTR